MTNTSKVFVIFLRKTFGKPPFNNQQKNLFLRNCADAGLYLLQANVDSQLPPQEWPLEALAVKMKQYCYLLEDLTAQVLDEQADGDYELLRGYLKRRAVDAFWQKVECLVKCLMSSVKCLVKT